MVSAGNPTSEEMWRYYSGLHSTRTKGTTQEYHFSIGAGGSAIAEVIVTMAGSTATKKTNYIYADERGSTKAVVEDTGLSMGGNRTAKVRKMSFDAWGTKRNPENWADSGNIFVNTSGVVAGYTGHLEREDFGLIDMGGRHYDPKIARFMRADVFEGFGQRYAYVFNDPINRMRALAVRTICPQDLGILPTRGAWL